MSHRFVFFPLILFLNLGAGNELPAGQLPPGSPAVQGAWLAGQVRDRDTGRDGRTTMRMRLYDRQSRQRERILTVSVLKGATGRPLPADRTLVRFTYPPDIDGTGLLVWDQPGGDDERFLYLPSLGRVRRIAGSEAQESFVGSDFTYEDIGGRELEKYDYTLLDARAMWQGADGVSHAAYTLESRHRTPNARFPRVVSLVRADNFVVVHAEIYNKRNEVQKIFDVRRLDKVHGYWTSLAMSMRDVPQGTRTELLIERADYNIGLGPDDFSRRALEQGAVSAVR